MDHFHPESVGLHLQNNPQAVLVSSEQIADAVKKDFRGFQTVEPRVRRITHQWKSKVLLNTAGINLKVLGLRHAGAQFNWVQNLGYVVEIDGTKLLHLGDGDMTFSSFDLPQEGIDIAFINLFCCIGFEST